MADYNIFGQQNQPIQQQFQQGINQNPYYQNNAWGTPYVGYQQQFGNQPQNQQPVQQTQQVQQVPYQQQNQQNQLPQEDMREYILLDGSAPNKKRKYVFVGEVDMQTNVVNPLPSFSLEDIRKIVSHEFDVRFGEEKKS